MVAADLVGVDIGGSKTRVRVKDVDGVISDHLVTTASWRPVEQARDPVRFIQVLNACATLTERSMVAVGAHGCDTNEQCETFREAISAHSPGDFTVVNDAELLAPALGLDAGIGVILGTGSVTVGRTGDNELITAGGWGWILGDPGSAPGLVREAVRAVLQEYDTGRSPGALTRVLFKEFGVEHEMELAYALTAAQRITEWSEHAPAVFEAVEAGSELAWGVLSNAADELVHSIAQLRSRNVQGDHVVVGGGVAKAQPDFSSLISGRIMERLPGVKVSVLDDEPLVGALELAIRRSNDPPQKSQLPDQPAATTEKGE